MTAIPLAMCRVCGAARPGGLDECAHCGASESECRRWRRRSDARWQQLRISLRVRTLLFFVAWPGLMIAVGVLAMRWGSSAPSRPVWIDALATWISYPPIRILTLGFAVAAGIAIDRTVRKLPTWNLVGWRWAGHIPVATLLSVLVITPAFRGGGFVPLALIALALPLIVAAIIRMIEVIAQMNRWVAADRRAAAGAHKGPVRVAWYRTRAASPCIWVPAPVALLALIDPKFLWIAAWLSWGLACVSAQRALGRWLRG